MPTGQIANHKYKDIALDWIKNRYNDIQTIYSKYYPNASDESLKSEPYRMLDNVRFKNALLEAWKVLKVKDLEIAKEVVLALRSEMFTAKESSSRIAAASWLGRTQAMFTDKTEVSGHITHSQEEEDEYNDIKRRVGLPEVKLN